MTKLSIGTGLLLIAIGLGFYFGTGAKSVTAMIPSFFGIVILLCGLISKSPAQRKVSAHIGVAAAVLGILGGLGMAIPKIIKAGGTIATAQYAQLILGVVCLIYVFFAIQSFAAARKAMKSSES